MALITRVGRLFRADLHAVLDRVEEPEVLLRQAIREMEEELAEDRQRLRLERHGFSEFALSALGGGRPGSAPCTPIVHLERKRVFLEN